MTAAELARNGYRMRPAPTMYEQAGFVIDMAYHRGMLNEIDYQRLCRFVGVRPAPYPGLLAITAAREYGWQLVGPVAPWA